ncbi:MAG: TIGR03905 family TSCPD domain-containing protein [Eubacteriales bacterium]
MRYEFRTSGVCSRKINIEVEDNTIKAVDFEGGCQGNLRGISALIVGMNIDEVIARVDGIDCGGRGTSCPDQLSMALQQIKAQG